MLEESAKDTESKSIDPKEFDSPSWAFKQAFLNGRKYQIKELRQLLEFIKG